MKRMIAIIQKALSVLLVLGACATAQADVIRVKDLGKIKGWRDNALFGTGIVTGLAGTGDSPGNRTTRQSLSNVMSQFNLTIAPEAVQSRNVAVVMVSAILPTFAREGDTLDVTVSSSGDARSLVGGTLLLTSLKAANGRVYALGQGPLSVGGYRYDANGNVVQKNHPTTGSIPNGATVEVGVEATMLDPRQSVTFVLAEPDYTTASRVASAISSQLGGVSARARDASGIEISVPPGQADDLVPLLTRIENVTVEPDRRAKVVINERTGTVVSGGDVRISKVAISHGDIKIAIATQNTVSQPINAWNAGPDVRTAIVTNTRIDVDEQNGAGFVAGSNTVSDLVQSLARLKTSTRDVISILRAVKAAGALHGELVVQ
ncbi:flagellar basal body P-ring protein FlgI [Variovorax arabinosiphilus]|uniref:flagellar basal body P-ring protein FlgI n=1 Tax=Variovorax arabinosiphilus TaxID=3053498 RepID=UPI002575A75B|nr:MULTISPECIES: flagellar basal body P-ring protein FlgI [unclassified Variovorax]MDM0122186.1 flagellar basal body P-ring protein FlgI [Variovorax sp. J2L1-78]MDM0131285.1 flagellar basal body P-ring protein FlgI [Variovorax sp. J2L1-63]MDM0234949.1 flagellar basal body P-ring protein FlgI [Variovorax sp. J2R1-6]